MSHDIFSTKFARDGKADPLTTTDYKEPPVVCYKQTGFAGYDEGCGTLRANGGDVGGVLRASSSSVYDTRGNGDGVTAPTMTGHHNANISDYTALIVERNDE